MTQETMNAVGVFVTRAVMVKGQYATAVASEEQGCGKTCGSGANNYAIVQFYSSLLCAQRNPSTSKELSSTMDP
jgi:hypothetical protein